MQKTLFLAVLLNASAGLADPLCALFTSGDAASITKPVSRVAGPVFASACEADPKCLAEAATKQNRWCAVWLALQVLDSKEIVVVRVIDSVTGEVTMRDAVGADAWPAAAAKVEEHVVVRFVTKRRWVPAVTGPERDRLETRRDELLRREPPTAFAVSVYAGVASVTFMLLATFVGDDHSNTTPLVGLGLLSALVSGGACVTLEGAVGEQDDELESIKTMLAAGSEAGPLDAPTQP